MKISTKKNIFFENILFILFVCFSIVLSIIISVYVNSIENYSKYIEATSILLVAFQFVFYFLSNTLINYFILKTTNKKTTNLAYDTLLIYFYKNESDKVYKMAFSSSIFVAINIILLIILSRFEINFKIFFYILIMQSIFQIIYYITINIITTNIYSQTKLFIIKNEIKYISSKRIINFIIKEQNKLLSKANLKRQSNIVLVEDKSDIYRS